MMRSATAVMCLLPFLLFGAPAFADDPKPAEPVTVEEPAESAADASIASAADTVEPPDVPDIGDDMGGFIEEIVNAFNAKDWGIFAGLIIMALVWVLKKFVWKALPTGALPWVSAGAGVAVAIATGLGAGLVWWKAILNGLTVGAAASGLWSLIGKHIFGKNDKDNEEEKKKED